MRSAGRRSRIACSSTPSSEPCARRGGGLLADALGAGDPVGRVAAQGDEVGHLLGIDPVSLADLLRGHLLGAAAAGAYSTVVRSDAHW